MAKVPCQTKTKIKQYKNVLRAKLKKEQKQNAYNKRAFQ